MNKPSLADLRAEFVEAVIGPLLEELLYSVVASTAPSYPALEYNPSGVWNNDTILDATHDWITDRLLERGDLGPILASAKTENALHAILERSFKQHLINRRATSSATNLFSRMVVTLRADFVCVTDTGTVGERRWTLKGSTAADNSAGVVVDDLINYAAKRSDADLGVVRYGPFSLKSSPILRADQLRNFVADLLAEAAGSVSTTELFTVLRHRFNLATLPPAAIQSIAEDSFERSTVPTARDRDAAHESAVARIVLSRLTAQQITDLRIIADAESVAAAVRATGRTATDLGSSLEASMALIADHVESIDEARRVHQLIVESLYQEN